MLSPNQLERASDAYRLGYTHKAQGMSKNNQATPGTFGYHDYEAGWKAAENDLRWSQPQQPKEPKKIHVVYEMHIDAAHGWLRVPRTAVNRLEIQNQISSYSYQCGTLVYLEEDCDALLFLQAFEERFGVRPKINVVNDGNNSPIRRFKPFTA